jgi:hypothetical protein
LANCVDECSDVSNLHLYKFCCPFIVIKLHCIQRQWSHKDIRNLNNINSTNKDNIKVRQVNKVNVDFFTSLFANSFVFVLKIHMVEAMVETGGEEGARVDMMEGMVDMITKEAMVGMGVKVDMVMTKVDTHDMVSCNVYLCFHCCLPYHLSSQYHRLSV